MMHVNCRRKSPASHLALAGAGNNVFENSFTGPLPSDLGSITSLSRSLYHSNFGMNLQNSGYVVKPRFVLIRFLLAALLK